MTDRPKSTFAKRLRAARPRERAYEVRDDIVSGLCATIQPTGVRTFFLARMVRGKRRYATIGSAGSMTVPKARREARRLIASYIEPAVKDCGPKTPGHPMTAFADEFLERHGRHWKPRTLETNSRIVRKSILPAFGHRTVDAITDDDVKRWFASLGERPGVANRAMPVLSVMMRMAELWGYRAHNTTPCKRTRRYRMKPKERFLTADEMARLNAVLTRDEFYCPHVVAIVRLLMLTGCRFGEIASLEWDWIKGKRIYLRDSKTGPRSVLLGEAARAVIDALPGPRDPDAFLFPRLGGSRHAHRLVTCWRTVRDDANLGKVRLHDLRHTAASHAVMSGENLPLVGKLLGHRRHETTAGYAHLADGHLVETAEKVGSLIAEAMGLDNAPPPSRARVRRRYGCWV